MFASVVVIRLLLCGELLLSPLLFILFTVEMKHACQWPVPG